MPNKLSELGAQVSVKAQRVNELYTAADTRGDGVNTKEELAEIKTLNQELDALETQIAEITEHETGRQRNNDRIKSLKTGTTGVPFSTNGQGGSDGASAQPLVKSVGDFVMTDQAMADWLKQWQDRPPANKTAINSPRIEVKSLLGERSIDAALKTLITGAGATSGGPLVIPDFQPIVDQRFQRPLTIRDIVTNGQTGSDSLEYVRVTSVTNNAAPVAEATATSGSSGTKPESAMAMERVSESVKTIAHWIPATNRALADAPQLRTLIDNFLRYGLEEELEDQMLTGNGSGENFTGILNVSGTTAQAFDTNILTTTRKARTKVRTVGRATPTAWVMHPTDWESIDLLQDNEARYYYGGPANLGQPRLWGLPVVESEGMTVGTAVVADWRMAILWDRLQTAISMSNAHADFFIRNLVAILAEMRAAFGVIRPSAFVIADLTA